MYMGYTCVSVEVRVWRVDYTYVDVDGGTIYMGET